jgi:hypothetical protein
MEVEVVKIIETIKTEMGKIEQIGKKADEKGDTY